MILSTAHLLNRRYNFRCSAGAALFDGTNDWLKLGSDMLSNADGTQGIFSVWINFTSATSVRRSFYANIGKTVIFERTAAGKFQITLKNSGATSTLVFTGSTTYGIGALPVPNNFTHFIASWDTNFSAGNKKCVMLINGATETLTKTDLNPAFTIKYTDTAHSFLADNGADKWAGSVGSLYFNNSEYIDLSNPNNLLKFRQIYNGQGFPAVMAQNGAISGGTAPIVFFNNPFSTFGTNLGYGGGYLVQGALTEASPVSPCIIETGGDIIPGEGF